MSRGDGATPRVIPTRTCPGRDHGRTLWPVSLAGSRSLGNAPPVTDSSNKLNRTLTGATILVSMLLACASAGGLWSLGKIEAAIEQTNARLAEQPAYEYDVVFIEDLEWTTRAQEIGRAGWEIVSARRAKGADDKYGYECITRRRIAGEAR